MVVAWSLGIGSNFQGTANAWGAAEAYGTAGSVSVIGTLSATWYVTGVQLEVGTQATSFEYRQYQQELALCQRYCVKYGGSKIYEHIGQGSATSTTVAQIDITLATTMRTTPSVTTSGNFMLGDGVSNTAVTSFSLSSSGDECSPNVVALNSFVASGLTQFRPYFLFAGNSLASSLIVTAEL